MSKYEALAKDIYNWCIEHELWDDNTIYFNGKAWSNLPTWGGEKGIKIGEDLYEYADRNPKHYFEYANPDTLSMSFEGGLNHVLNDYGKGCLPLIEEFRELFHKYGLYWEFGNSWNLSAAKEMVSVKVGFLAGTRVVVYDEEHYNKRGVITQVGYDGHDDLYVIDLDDGGDIILMDDEFEVED